MTPPQIQDPPLRFDYQPRFTRELPGDPSGHLQPRQTPNVCWSHCPPTRVAAPRLLAWFPEVAALLGLSAADMQRPEMVEVLAGNRVLPGMTPYAACYGGHQFGQWAGQLGDGRAITLAEIVHDGRRWDIQLKGAGLTPYSRTADGRAVLRSSIREFLCSEAMYHLGIPTTRALSLVATGERVVRDMFYDGRPQAEPGAIVCRVAPSFIRLGNFEILAARDERELLDRLVDFTIDRDFPELTGTREERRAAWFVEVCRRTARLVVEWQRVGFVHGVMNTDNLSILGLTIDYGPYGWLDNYDPDWTPNTTDAQGRRYRFGNQPAIARWNLMAFANALAAVLPDHDVLRDGIARYAETLDEALPAMQAEKFGLAITDDSRADDHGLIDDAYGLLHQANMDFTLFFRALAEVDVERPDPERFDPVFYEPALWQRHAGTLRQWLDRYCRRIRDGQEPHSQRVARMNRANPWFILRNYLAQQAIDAAERGDDAELLRLMEVLRRPYAMQPGDERFAEKRPDWALNKPGCSMLSCSS
jgi:uncharacterized protein YdiU (UPF0061 family)